MFDVDTMFLDTSDDRLTYFTNVGHAARALNLINPRVWKRVVGILERGDTIS